MNPYLQNTTSVMLLGIHTRTYQKNSFEHLYGQGACYDTNIQSISKCMDEGSCLYGLVLYFLSSSFSLGREKTGWFIQSFPLSEFPAIPQ